MIASRRGECRGLLRVGSSVGCPGLAPSHSPEPTTELPRPATPNGTGPSPDACRTTATINASSLPERAAHGGLGATTAGYSGDARNPYRQETRMWRHCRAISALLPMTAFVLLCVGPVVVAGDVPGLPRSQAQADHARPARHPRPPERPRTSRQAAAVPCRDHHDHQPQSGPDNQAKKPRWWWCC
jgi:hypothetical protein